ncbi:LysR substrate-binding domain-containing protein [Vibrio sp. M60_M31a]
MTSSVATTALATVLNEFEKELPDVSLRFVEGMLPTVLPGLMEGDLDFAIAVAELEQLPYEIVFEPLTQILSEPVAREGHLLTRSHRLVADVICLVGTQPRNWQLGSAVGELA